MTADKEWWGLSKSFKKPLFLEMEKGVNMKLTYLLHILTILLIVIGGAYALNSFDSGFSSLSGDLNQINKSVNGLTNNADFSMYSKEISNATILIQIVGAIPTALQQSGNVFTASDGSLIGGGTGFSIGDGVIITAAHVVNGVDKSNMFITWNGIKYDNSVISSVAVNSYYDLAFIKTNLTLPAVRMFNGDRAVQGAKIGFVGYPLGSTTPMLNDGIISSVKNEDTGFFWYTINSFVNHGNSGGAVFLSDTGEVIGLISQNPGAGMLQIPQINTSVLTPGESIIYQVQLILAYQLSSNYQIGIGNIVGLNQNVINNIKNAAK